MGSHPGDHWSSALKVAVVGPTHPYKGGVAAHTTMLAHHLAEAGHDVTLVSWATSTRPGCTRASRPCPVARRTCRPSRGPSGRCRWARPDTWVRAGRRLRGFDAVDRRARHPAGRAGPPGAAARRRRGPVAPARPSVVIAHNVLPHETPSRRPALMQALLRTRRRGPGAQRRAGRAWPPSSAPRGSRSPTSRRTCRAGRPPSARRTTAHPAARPGHGPRVQGRRRAAAGPAPGARGRR